MVDRARLERLLSAIAGELNVLEDLAGRPDDELVADQTAIRAVKYAFVVAIEASIDAAQHVISAEGWRVPESFADAFAVLDEGGILDDEVADAMADAARFRNLLVHGYADVDDRRVLDVLRNGTDALRAYVAAIAALAG